MPTQDPINDRLPSDPGPKGSNRLPSDLTIDQQEGLSGQQQGYKYDDYRFQPKLGADNNKLRAQDQGFWESSAIRLGNLIPNIAGGVVEGLGYLGSLVTEWGDDRDYNNQLTQFGNSMKNPFGTVYRENPDKIWDLSDPAWWGDAFFGLVESAASFALEGAGLAKVFSGIAGLAKGTQLAKAAKGIAQVSTAATLAYTEGAMSGARIFDQVYQTQFNKLLLTGIDPAEAAAKAKHIASNAAAATVQLNTIVNTALNIPQIAPLFHTEDDIARWWKGAGKRQSGESYQDWTARVKAMDPMGISDIRKLINPRHAGFTHLAVGALSEGTEEMVNQFAERRGYARGEAGKELRGLGDLLGDLNHFFDDTMNSEGALNFVLGSIGGLAQDVFIDKVPMHSVTTDADGKVSRHAFDGEVTEDGKYKKRLVSTSYLTATGNRQYFDNVKDKVVADINRVAELKTKIAEATVKGDLIEANRLKMSLFDTGALNAVQLGMGDSFAAQFEEIGALDNTKSLHEGYVPQIQQLNQAIAQESDPIRKQELVTQREAMTKEMQSLQGVTEAMQKGFAKDTSDNAYKTKAQKAVGEINHYKKLWDDIHKKYNSGDEWDSRYADYLFGKEIEMQRRGNIIQEEEQRIRESEARRDLGIRPDEDAVTTKAISDVVSDETARTNLRKEEARIRRAMNDIASADPVKKAAAFATLQDIASKYSVTAATEDDLIPGAHQVLSVLQDKLEDYDNKSTDAILSIETSEGYQKWKAKNPGKTVVDYIKVFNRRTREDDAIAQDKQKLAEFQEQTSVAASNLRQLRSSKGRQNYIAGAKKTQNKLVKKIKETVDKNNAAAIDKMYDGKNVTELSQVQKSQYLELLTKRKAEMESKLRELKNQRSEAAKRIHELANQNLIKRMGNAVEIGKLNRRIDKLSDRIKSMEAALTDLNHRIEELTASDPADTTGLPPQVVSDNILVEGTDEAFEAWLGSPIAYDNLLDSIWALRTTGTEQEMLIDAQDLLADTLQSVDHPYLYQGPEERAKSTLQINEFLIRQLNEAGKIQEPKVDSAQGLLATVASFGLSQEKAAQLLTELDVAMQEPQFEAAIIPELGTYYGLTMEQMLQLDKAVQEDLAAKESTADKVVEAITDVEGEKSEEESTSEEPKVTIASIPDLLQVDSNKGQNFSMSIQTYSAQDNMTHGGLKVERAIKANVLTHEYFEELSSPSVYTKTDKFSLNPKLNPLYVKPGYLKAGTKLTLAIDTAWKGTINEDNSYSFGGPSQRPDEFSFYAGPDGKIDVADETKYGNVPIKIVDPISGTTLGYLPRVDWVTAKYEGTNAEDYRNVVDTKYGPDGELVYTDNVNTQKKALLDLRKKLALAHNAGMTSLPTTITSRSRGIPLRVEPAKASELLPDPSLRLALLGGSTVSTGRGQAVVASVPGFIAEGESFNNIPGVLLPDASGAMNFEPLWTDRLEQGDVDTVVKAIEIYLSLGTENEGKAREHARTLLDATGFDVTDPHGLQGFINQYYYYTSSFDDAEIMANKQILGQDKRQSEFKLAVARSAMIGESKVVIKTGMTFLGRLAYASLENGRLNEDFKQLLSEGLTSRFRNVVFANADLGIRGINTGGKISEVVYHPNSDSFSTKEHESYNDFIKEYSKTTMYGKLKSSSGDYVYYAHPNTQLNMQETMAADIISKQKRPRKSSARVIDPTKLSPEEEQDLLDMDLGTSLSFKPEIRTHEIGPSSIGTLVGTAVTLENLENLRNFTPLQNRNSLTPAEALQEMRRLGISIITEGYNPFYSC